MKAWLSSRLLANAQCRECWCSILGWTEQKNVEHPSVLITVYLHMRSSWNLICIFCLLALLVCFFLWPTRSERNENLFSLPSQRRSYWFLLYKNQYHIVFGYAYNCLFCMSKFFRKKSYRYFGTSLHPHLRFGMYGIEWRRDKPSGAMVGTV